MKNPLALFFLPLFSVVQIASTQTACEPQYQLCGQSPSERLDLYYNTGLVEYHDAGEWLIEGEKRISVFKVYSIYAEKATGYKFSEPLLYCSYQIDKSTDAVQPYVFYGGSYQEHIEPCH